MVVYQAPRTDLKNDCHVLFSVNSSMYFLDTARTDSFLSSENMHDMRDDLLKSSARQDSFEQVGNSAKSFLFFFTTVNILFYFFNCAFVPGDGCKM